MESIPSEGLVWYFSYGSNLDPERFRDRVGDWRERRAAELPGYRLRFSGDVQSEGGGGAVIEEDDGGRVHGAVFRIGRAQLEAMDRVELGSDRNVEGKGRRCTIRVESGGEELEAEVYLVAENRSYRAPSPAYLGHILRGLGAAGHPEEVLDRVRRIAEAEPRD